MTIDIPLHVRIVDTSRLMMETVSICVAESLSPGKEP